MVALIIFFIGWWIGGLIQLLMQEDFSFYKVLKEEKWIMLAVIIIYPLVIPLFICVIIAKIFEIKKERLKDVAEEL